MDIDKHPEKFRIAAIRNKKEKEYWLAKMSGELHKSVFPVDNQKSTPEGQTMESLRFGLGEDIYGKLMALSKQSDYSLHVILIAGLTLLMAQYTGHRDIIVGTPIYKSDENDGGDPINTVLPIRTPIEWDSNFRELLYRVRQNVIEADEHLNYPLELLVEQLGLSAESGQFPLFDVGILLENIHNKRDLQRIPLNVIYCFSRIDGQISGVIEYNSHLYLSQSVKRIETHLVCLIQNALEDIDRKVADIEFMSKQEKEELQYNFNRTELDYPEDKTIHELIDAQAARIPDRISLVYNDQYLTYKEMNRVANWLAWKLKLKGVSPGSIVGIMVDHSLEMVEGILGVLKAGGAYLPIDSDTPENRVLKMLNDCRVSIVLTKRRILNKKSFSLPQVEAELVKGQFREIVYLDELDIESLKDNETNRLPVPHSNDLAYVIYTSGSSGVPKGVMVENRSLVNLCNWHNNHYGVTEKDRATKYAGFGFDASVWEIFPYLMAGASIYMIPEEMKLDLNLLGEYFDTHNITVAFLPTQIGEQFMKQNNRSLRKLLVGGDKLRLVGEVDYEVHNNYGPTENTVVASSCRVVGTYDNIPIGKPVANNRLYIVNPDTLHLLPVGVPGELLIAGCSLSRGYINDPELSSRKFSEHPILGEERLYRTGDLTRWTPEGDLEFFGRQDQQLKIRGNRIEIGEIEKCILGYQKIQEVVVMARERDVQDQYLCAYIIAEKSLELSELKKYLTDELPVYMIPSIFIQVETIPLTASGKVDRRALEKSGTRLDMGREYIAPRTREEKIVADIWKQVLGVERVGVNDNFFDLGGTSLKIIQLTNLLNETFEIGVSVITMFRYTTVKAFVQYLNGQGEDVIQDRRENIDHSRQQRIALRQQRRGMRNG
jgi:amino acid adenylation domain-containing protein